MKAEACVSGGNDREPGFQRLSRSVPNRGQSNISSRRAPSLAKSFQANYGHATYLTYVPGREAEWEKEFRKLIAMRPADMHGYPFPAVYQSFVDGLIRSGQEWKARSVLKEALALYPNSLGLQALARKLPAEEQQGTPKE